MKDELFIAVLATALSLLLAWGFRVLPGEKWQILAALPREKEENGTWRATNLTYYGIIIASSYTLSLALVFVLLGSSGMGLFFTGAVATAMVFICLPASRIVARVVERKTSTLTVGGASFVGTLLSPWVVAGFDMVEGGRALSSHGVMAVIAAFSIAYALGEGTGRLACISFGCCYGKPVDKSPRWLRTMLLGWNFIFSGNTKKIAYASGLDGVRVLPVQGMTAVLYISASLAGSYAFLKGYMVAAYLVPLLVTQMWRVLSECIRADYRGEGKWSFYQTMSIFSILYGVFVALFLPSAPHGATDIVRGLVSLWDPGLILFLQVVWVVVFLFTGRSTVTGAMLSFHVQHERT